MKQITHYFGFDVSKEKLDMSIVSSDGKVLDYLEIANTKQQIKKELSKVMKKYGLQQEQSVFCVENTGVYSLPITTYLYSISAQIWLASSIDIKKSMGLIRGKNDKIDSVRIALYAMRNIDKFKLWEPSREVLLKLDSLLKTRNRLLKAKQMLRVPVAEIQYFVDRQIVLTSKKHSQASIHAINKDIKLVEKEILQLVHRDDQVLRQYQILTSIPGIGMITAINLMVKTKEFTAFETAEQFACYCGLAPFEHTSGSSVRGKTRVSHYADKKIKTILHLAALSTITSKGELREYYQRKVNAGKNKMAVLNAIRNKIIHRAFCCIRENRLYEKNYQKILA